MTREMLIPLARNRLHDLTLEARPWGVPLKRIEVPIEIWHGEDDHVVSPEQSRLLARTLPLVTEHFVPGEGHFSLFARHAEEVMQSFLIGTTTARTPGFGPRA